MSKRTSVLFFNPRGKWKYEDFLILGDEPDYKQGDPFRAYVQKGLDVTPLDVRETRISELGDYWTVVVPEPPIGYPIMSKGTED